MSIAPEIASASSTNTPAQGTSSLGERIASVEENSGVQTPKGVRRESLLPLTSLRFFAALCVLISHYSSQRYLPPLGPFSTIMDQGRSAVALFFVLSGFILTYNYEGKLEGKERIRSYFLARFARIYPVVLLSLVIASIPIIYLVSNHDTHFLVVWYQVKSHAAFSLSVALICQLLLLIGWIPLGVITEAWNSPAWSLSCEAFFYLLFPRLLRKLTLLSNKVLVGLLLALWLAQGAWLCLNFHVGDSPRNLLLIYKFPPSHLFDFVLGVVVGLWFLRAGAERRLKFRGLALAITAVALLLTTLLSFHSFVLPPYYLMTPVFALLIVSMATANTSLPWISKPFLVLLGEASYSLYMIHFPLIYCFQILRIPHQYGFVLMLVTIGLSIVVFRFYEEPARKYIRKRTTPSKPVLTA